MHKKTTIRIVSFLLTVLITSNICAQQGNYKAQLIRKDSNNIVFAFEWKTEKGQPVWYIKNAAEKIRVANITVAGDSFLVEMPVFESQLRFAYHNHKLSGRWIKRGAVQTQVMPFIAEATANRFTQTSNAKNNISGKWAVNFSGNKSGAISVAQFEQKGNHLTGTFLNASGDYRYLEGIVTNDTLLLSGFDGSHAFLFKAHILNDTTIANGIFYAGATGKESWSAVKNNTAAVAEESVAMFAQPGQDSLNFSFKNLAGKLVSINDTRFKNKVTIVQLMGSWCPNCMDETAFLSDYYNNNHQRGIEVVALAYEYTTDWNRSVKSLKKFQQRFNVQYPILNTEVTVTDSLRTEKTLPQVTRIKFYPSSIILDKKGKIRKLDTGFNGPATGEKYLAYKKEFETLVNQLLKEN